MNKPDPVVIIVLQSAGFTEKQIANALSVDERTVNDYLDCYNTGFDCAMLYVGNRLEKAGISVDLIDAVLGVSMYTELRDSILSLPTMHKDREITLEKLKRYLNPKQIEALKNMKEE